MFDSIHRLRLILDPLVPKQNLVKPVYDRVSIHRLGTVSRAYAEDCLHSGLLRRVEFFCCIGNKHNALWFMLQLPGDPLVALGRTFIAAVGIEVFTDLCG